MAAVQVMEVVELMEAGKRVKAAALTGWEVVAMGVGACLVEVAS